MPPNCYTPTPALKPHRFLFYRKSACPAKRSHRAVHADRNIRAVKETPVGCWTLHFLLLLTVILYALVFHSFQSLFRTFDCGHLNKHILKFCLHPASLSISFISFNSFSPLLSSSLQFDINFFFNASLSMRLEAIVSITCSTN